MFKHVLIPTDGSELSEAAIGRGVAFAKAMGARVTGVTVSRPFLLIADRKDEYSANAEKHAQQRLKAIAEAAGVSSVSFQAVHLFSENPYQAIIDTANDRGCDVISMASHGRRGMSAVLLGSETLKVLTHSKIPVLVWR